MKSNFKALLCMAGMTTLMLTFTSCTKHYLEEEISGKLKLENQSMLSATSNSLAGCMEAIHINDASVEAVTPTVLGAPLNGTPFSLANMKQAAVNLYGRSTGITVTHRYVRFKPANDDQLKVLSEIDDLEFFDYPLDRDVITEGDYYPQPGVGENELPWLYTVIPVVYTYPTGITYEVLQDIHITDRPTLEEEALRITNNAANEECSTGSAFGAPVLMTPPIDDGPVDPCVGCGVVTPGLPSDPAPSNKTPAGFIRVRDKQLGVDQGVPGARIVARRWFKIDRVYTDQTGFFRCARSFRNKVNILVKMKNSGLEVRGIKGIRFWQMWFPVKTSIGKYSGTLNNINFVFADDNRDKTNQHLYWFAATLLRSYADYNQAATEIGVGQVPSGLRVLLTTLNAGGTGSTPMNRHRTNAGAMPQALIDYFIAHPGTTSLSQLYNYLYNSKLLAGVDMSLSYHVPNWASSDARELIYHELTHAAHFNQVGQVWWNTFVYGEAAETARYGTGGVLSPYGDGTMGEISDYIAVGESWAYHLGHFMADRTYGANSAAVRFTGKNFFNGSPVAGLSANLNALEDFDPRDPNYPFRWMPSGVFYDLLDDRAEAASVNDNVAGYTNQQFFNALTSDVKSITQFRNRLLLNSGNNQQNDVNILFLSYGY